MKTHPTLAGYILGLPQILQRTLSSISRNWDGEWALSFALMLPHDVTSLVAPDGCAIREAHAGDRLLGAPEITQFCMSRHPDIRLHTEEPDDRGALRRLDATGIVGRLNIHQHKERTVWHVNRTLAKTHAGSQEERNRWLLTKPSL